MAKKRLLIISDDQLTTKQLSRTFAESDYRIFTESTNMHAVFHLCFLQPDLVILKMGPSREKGQKVLQGIRDWSFVPVIALLPPGDALGKVEALNAGADQCLSDYFDPKELKARARALLRRVEATTAGGRIAPVPV
jgi:DNA-binding response OmpR family regulator